MGHGQLRAKLNIQQTWETVGDRVVKHEKDFEDKLQSVSASVPDQLVEFIDKYVESSKRLNNHQNHAEHTELYQVYYGHNSKI